MNSTQNCHNASRLFETHDPAAVFRNSIASVCNLSTVCLLAKLRNQFIDLAETSRPHWMAFADKPAGGVDRNPSSDCRVSAQGRRAALAGRTQAQTLT